MSHECIRQTCYHRIGTFRASCGGVVFGLFSLYRIRRGNLVNQDHNLHAGDVVPVYIQSNIGGVYVIGTVLSGRTYRSTPLADRLAQVPLPSERPPKLEEYRYTYASVKIDGLPVRARPENTARQVYRLRRRNNQDTG